MSQTSSATQANAEQSLTQSLQSQVDQLVLENRKLREEAAAFEVRAVLVSQYEDQRLIDAARFRAILANNRSGILLFAPNGNVVEVVQSIFGYEKNQLLGHNVDRFMSAESAARFRSDLEYVVQTPGAKLRAQYCTQDAAGENRWLEAILSDHLSHVAINAVICNYLDITETR